MGEVEHEEGESLKTRYLNLKWSHCWKEATFWEKHHRLCHCHSAAVTSCSTLGTLLVTASADTTARVWDLATTRQVAKLCHHEPQIFARLLSPSLVLTAGPTQTTLWRLPPEEAAPRVVRTFHQGQSPAACATAWDNYVALGCSDGAVRVYDVFSGCMTKLHRLHRGRVTALQHSTVTLPGSPQPREVFVSGCMRSVHVCDADTGTVLAEAGQWAPVVVIIDEDKEIEWSPTSVALSRRSMHAAAGDSRLAWTRSPLPAVSDVVSEVRCHEVCG